MKNQDPTINVLHIVKLSVKRLDDLRKAESRRVNEQMASSHQHSAELRELEAKRIDAIRAVDVQAVASANEKAIQQADVLAKQLVTTADRLNERVSKVESEQSKNQGSGKGKDDQWAKIVIIVLALMQAYQIFKPK
jgi:hypothetical protein